MSSRYYSVSDALTSRYGPKDEEETTPKRKNGNRKKTTARKRPASRVETSDNPFFEGKSTSSRMESTSNRKGTGKRIIPVRHTTTGKNPRSLDTPVVGSYPPVDRSRPKSTTTARRRPASRVETSDNPFSEGKSTSPKAGGTPKVQTKTTKSTRAGLEKYFRPGVNIQQELQRGQTKRAVKGKAPARLGTTSQMKKDKDMISGIGAQAAKGKAPVKKGRAATKPFLPAIGGAPDYSELTRPKKKAPVKKGRAATKPFLPPIGGAPDYSELTRPRKTSKPAPNTGLKDTAKTTKKPTAPSDYSPIMPKGSEELIGDKKVGAKKVDKTTKSKTTKSKTAKSKPAAKEKSFRERRAERLKKRLASESVGESRKKRIKRRLSRVEGRIEKAKDKKEEKARKPKKMMGGGEYKKYAKGDIHKTSNKPKVRGAGIARKGVRPAKMR